MKKYQGEDIYFSLNFTNSSNNNITSFDDLENVIVYAYTGEDDIVKFSKVPKDGYEPLSSVSPTNLKGVIRSEFTKLMTGQIMLDIMCIATSVDGDKADNIIQRAMSGIYILPSIIKDEAVDEIPVIIP